MSYFLSGALGGLLAFIFSIPALLLEIIEQGKVKNIPLIVDLKILWGKQISKYTVFSISLLFHILLGFLFGLFYPFFERYFRTFTTTSFSFFSLIVYSMIFWIFIGGALFPLMGGGLFGRKEGRRVWLELLLSFFLIGFFLWLAIQYYEPVFFVT